MPTWEEFTEWASHEARAAGGRPALRRRWERLRLLASKVEEQLPEGEVVSLLGKPASQLDPEENDVKALVAYGLGKGILSDPSVLRQALAEDIRSDPLFFLAQHSGKTFGEKYAPSISGFWLQGNGDGWIKQNSRAFYDIAWTPRELSGQEIRIELKASSEHPHYLFQQVRHYWLSGSSQPDYDLLLCLGVTAGSLEWWAIPARMLDHYANNGSNDPDGVVITRQHGKDRLIWNDESGYADEGWFRTRSRERMLLGRYASASEDLRKRIVEHFA